MDVFLRPIERRDAERLAILLDQLGYPSTTADVAARLDYWMDDPAGALIGAEVGKNLVGVVALYVVPILEVTGRVGRLVALVVDERHRGQGVGRALVKTAQARAAQAGCIMMEVTSSRSRTAAHVFYRGLGYEDVCPGSARFTRFLGSRREPDA